MDDFEKAKLLPGHVIQIGMTKERADELIKAADRAAEYTNGHTHVNDQYKRAMLNGEFSADDLEAFAFRLRNPELWRE